MPLIIAANRDEFYRRKAAPVGWWPGGNVLAGRDLGYSNGLAGLWSRLGGRAPRAYGTWLGVNIGGNFATLTNYREPGRENKNAKSRGLLVSEFLASNTSITDYADRLDATRHEYNGYNLLFGNQQSLFWFSNRSDAGAQELQPGIYGLSNALLDTPWPKVVKTKAAFTSLPALPDAEQVFSKMADADTAADAEVQQTGLPFEIEKGLSSAFVKLPGYGTRVTSFVTFSHTGDIDFCERTYHKGKPARDRKVAFKLAP